MKKKKLILAVRETGVSRHNGVQLRAPLKPLNTIVLWCAGSFRAVLNCVLYDAKRGKTLGQLYVWSVFFFPAWNKVTSLPGPPIENKAPNLAPSSISTFILQTPSSPHAIYNFLLAKTDQPENSLFKRFSCEKKWVCLYWYFRARD